MAGGLAVSLLVAIASPVVGLRARDAGLATTGQFGVGVPFYMYDLPAWLSRCDKVWRTRSLYYPDVAFTEIMVDHPWRVRNLSKAKLFVVPGYFGMSAAGWCGNHSENIQETADMLSKSSSFLQSQGRDHVVPAFSYWANPKSMLPIQHLSNIIALHFEGTADGEGDFKHTIVVPYASIGIRNMGHAAPVVQKNRTLFFMGQADNRYAYRSRRRALHLLPAVWNDSVLVRTGETRHHHRLAKTTWDDPESMKADLPLCSYPRDMAGCWMPRVLNEYITLGAQSKYSLIIHGDTPSTARMYDSFYFDQVPMIISDEYRTWAMPFRDELPWESFAVFVSQEAFAKDAVGTMKAAVEEASRPEKLEMMRRVRPALDWVTGSDCIGTAVLVDAARRYLNMTSLPRVLDMPECGASLNIDMARRRRKVPVAEELNETLLEEVAMDGRFD